MSTIVMSKLADKDNEEAQRIVRNFLTTCGPALGYLLMEVEQDFWVYEKIDGGDRVGVSFQNAMGGFVRLVKDISSGCLEAAGIEVNTEDLKDNIRVLGAQIAPILFKYCVEGVQTWVNDSTTRPSTVSAS